MAARLVAAAVVALAVVAAAGYLVLREGSGPRGPVAPTVPEANPPSMQLAFQDDRTLLLRRGVTGGDPFGAHEREAERLLRLVYARMRDAGAGAVRMTVPWGRHENVDGSFTWDKLERAVHLAREEGFDVHLALTGIAEDWECARDYNPTGRGCEGAPTGVNPDPGEFARFAAAAARTLRGQVASYGIWNEPNLSSFLQGAAADEQNDLVPVALYRRLYDAGSRAIRAADPGAEVWMGELSEANRRGRLAPGAPVAEHSTLDVLEAIVRAGDGEPLVADGVAVHPYQHRSPPGEREKTTGIGRLVEVRRAIRALHGSRDAGGEPLLATPGGEEPPLHLTEFGYLSRPLSHRDLGGEGRHTTYWHDEAERARRFPVALERARRAGVRTIVLYHAVELVPPDGVGWDSGLIGPAGEVTGVRPYGKDPTGRDLATLDHPQPRAAYCAILRWATATGYATQRSACADVR